MADYPLFTYTRDEAIEDGFLIDVTDIARELTFIIDVALTYELFQSYLGDLTKDKIKDVKSILSRLKINRSFMRDKIFQYQVVLSNEDGSPRVVPVKAVLGVNDSGAPAITVMMPYES